MINVDHFDLNLLRVFHAVMTERSITGAASRLALSQPAASNALRRLREQCGDELFVRTANGMRATPFANALHPTVEAVLGSIKDALERHARFDPARSERSFSVLATDVGVMMFAPALIRHLHQVAPRVCITFRQTERERYADTLAAGGADLAIGVIPAGHPELMQQKLCDEPWVCMVGPGHTGVGRKLTLDQFLATPHITTVSPGLIKPLLARALGKRMGELQIVLEVQHFLTIPTVLAHNPFMSVIPQSVARTFMPLADFRVFPLPFRFDPVRAHQCWHRRSQHDPGHQWLRAQIAALKLL
ncbi:MAG TPA: LysR family transcriptional regulator [Ramlibacter sp.]|nr:LysR family transcriptional regulator [Ramlibacter sp.]